MALILLINIEMVLQSAAELNIRAREKIVSSINSHSNNWLTLSSLLKKKIKKRHAKQMKKIIFVQHTLIDQQIADLRARLPKKSQARNLMQYHYIRDFISVY